MSLSFVQCGIGKHFPVRNVFTLIYAVVDALCVIEYIILKLPQLSIF